MVTSNYLLLDDFELLRPFTQAIHFDPLMMQIKTSFCECSLILIISRLYTDDICIDHEEEIVILYNHQHTFSDLVSLVKYFQYSDSRSLERNLGQLSPGANSNFILL